jgi:hypothetical protein
MNFSNALSSIVERGTPNSNLVKYTSNLQNADLTDDSKLQLELDKVSSLSANDFVKLSGKYYRVAKYKEALEIALGKQNIDGDINKKYYGYEEYLNIDPTPISESVKDDVDITDLASLDAILVDAKKNLELIDDYILGLVTGRDFTQFSLQRSNNKFIKLANEASEETEENLEVVKDYYNELYDNDPNYGNVLVHPEEYHDKLTTEAKTENQSKFKKV